MAARERGLHAYHTDSHTDPHLWSLPLSLSPLWRCTLGSLSTTGGGTLGSRCLAAGQGRRERRWVFMLLHGPVSVLALRFRLAQEFPQYPWKLRTLIDVLVPVAKV